MIHVCSLARLPEMVLRTGAHHVVSLLAIEDRLTRPAPIKPVAKAQSAHFCALRRDVQVKIG